MCLSRRIKVATDFIGNCQNCFGKLNSDVSAELKTICMNEIQLVAKSS